MKIKRLMICAAIAASVVTSCNKDEEETTGNYLSGTLSFGIPEFVENGDTITVTPTGAWHPSVNWTGSYCPDSLGYYVTNPLTATSDTFKVFPTTSEAARLKAIYKMRVSLSKTVQKDTLGTFSITAYAYAPDYYSKSATASFTIVRSGYGLDCTLRGFLPSQSDDSVKIDGRTFYTKKAGGQEWLRENLATDGSGRQYKGTKAMRNIFGNYYTWTEAQSACPDGWRLTSSADWDSLRNVYPHVRDLMSIVTFNSDAQSARVWTYSANVGFPTDNSRITILPTGYATRNASGFSYYDKGVKAVFWTSDSDNGMGIARYIDEGNDEIFKSRHSKDNFAASVRCIRD